MTVKILTGHVLDRLKDLPDESVHMVLTSPPYMGLRSYQTEPQVWGGDQGCEHEWGEERQVIRGRNDEDPETLARRAATYSTGVKKANDAGNGSKSVGSTGAFCLRCHAWRGELGQEPQLDLFISHLIDVFRAVRRVLRKDGVLFCNIGDSFSAKSLNLAPQRLAIAMRDDGWIVRSVMPWVKRNCMPESVTDRPVTAVEDVILFTKASRYFWDSEAVKRTSAPPTGGRQRAALNGDDRYVGREFKNPEGGKNNKFYEYQPPTRNFRASDLFFDSLGLILDEPGDEPEPQPAPQRGPVDDEQSPEPRGYFAGVHASTPHIRHGADSRRAIHFPNGVQLSERANAGPGFDSLGLILDESGDPLALDVNPAGWKQAHFATFPPKLVRPLVLAGTSQAGACAACGAPWARLLDVESRPNVSDNRGKHDGTHYRTVSGGVWNDARARVNRGFAASCACPDPGPPVPCTVLDIFAGSGTTLLVADQLGRDAIGIDLNDSYALMSQTRVVSDAPLFAAVEISSDAKVPHALPDSRPTPLWRDTDDTASPNFLGRGSSSSDTE